MSINNEDLGRLEEIQGEFLDLLSEVDRIISQDIHVYNRAKAYWIAHIRTAITNDHEYLGGSMVTMEDTLQELQEVELLCNRCGCPEDVEEFIMKDGSVENLCPECEREAYKFGETE